MSLYLVQHGKNLPKEESPDQPLSETGQKEVQQMASVAREHGVKVKRIEHSPKLRAEETARIMGQELNPVEGVQEREGIKALDDVRSIVSQIDPAGDIMLIGHLPFMERLASYLVAGDQELLTVKFQNGGIVCLDKDMEKDAWYFKWMFMPHIN